MSEGLREALEELLSAVESSPCTFWACEGPDAEPQDMITCNPCRAVHEARKALAASPVRGIAEGGGITDDAVQRAREAYSGMCRSEHGSTPEARFRAALEAAYPLLGLQQVPSREEIARKLHGMDHVHRWRSDSCVDHGCEVVYLTSADAVLALFSKPAEDAGAETPCELHNRYPCWSCMKDQQVVGAES